MLLRYPRVTIVRCFMLNVQIIKHLSGKKRLEVLPDIKLWLKLGTT